MNTAERELVTNLASKRGFVIDENDGRTYHMRVANSDISTPFTGIGDAWDAFSRLINMKDAILSDDYYKQIQARQDERDTGFTR